MISRQHLTVSHAVLLLVVFLLPPVAVFSGLAVAPFYAVLLAVLLIEGLRKKAIHLPFSMPIFFFVLLAIWALASHFWAINSDRALSEWAATFAIILLSIVTFGVLQHLRKNQLEALTFALSIAIPLMLLLIAVELKFFGFLYSFFGTQFFSKTNIFFNAEVYNRGACFLAVIFWALLMAHSKRMRQNMPTSILLGVVSIATIVTLGMLESLSAKVAFVGGVVAFIAVLLMPVISIRLLQIAVILLAVGMVWYAPKLNPNEFAEKNIPPSALHRIFIWSFSGQKAAENMWQGYGFYNSRDIAGGKDVIALGNQSSPLGWVNLPNHSHNAMLQMWLELGLVGLSLYVLLIVTSLSWMLKYVQSTLQRAIMVAMLVTYLGISLLAFNVWQEWWIATGLLGFMLMRLYVDGFIDYAPCTRGGKTLR